VSGSLGLAFKISATDQATAKLDAVAKRINGLAKTSEQGGKSLAKIGEGTGGITKLSESMLSLGNNSLGAFRSIEQMVSPMAAITSAASIGGMVALEKAWASTGTTISKTAYSLGMPVDKLSGLEQGFRLAGSSAAAADKTVTGMNETLHNAFYGRDATAQANLNALGINWKDEKGNIADTQVALGQLSNWVKEHADPHAQARAISSVGGDSDALVALKGGKEGLDEWVRKADQTGSVWTKQMADHATVVQGAFSRLEEDLQGIGNRIADNWSGTATTVMTKTSDWIEHNKDLADSFAKIGTGIMALGLLKPAAWLMRMLGLGSLVPAAPAVAIAALGAGGAYAAGKAGEASAATTAEAGKQGYSAVSSVDDAGLPTAYSNPATGKTEPAGTFDPRFKDKPDVSAGDWWRKHAPTWAGGDPAATASSPPSGVRTNEDLLGHLANSQLGKLLAKGESGAADYNAVNRGAAGNYASGMENLVNMTVEEVQAAQKAHKFNAAGRYQIIGPTLDSAVTGLGLTGKEKFNAATQDRIFEQYLVGSKRSEIGDYVSGKSNDLHGALLGMSKEWASVADPDTGKSHYGGVGNNKASISVEDATQALNDARGHVHVEVSLKGAPPGTTAKATARGPVTASAPRIETAMASVG
jgi:hypothetical protein